MPDENPEHFLTIQEKREIINEIGLTLNESIYEYFNNSDRYDDNIA